MPYKNAGAPLKHIEMFAYLLAAWSFLVLFLEPIISYYFHYYAFEIGTALANLILLTLTIVNRLLNREQKTNRNILYLDVLMLLMGVLLLAYEIKLVVFFLLIRQTYFIVNFFLFRAFEGKVYKLLSENPPVSLMLSFAGIILAGTILLMLPAAATNGKVTHFVNALFTSTSATCVTGLVVVDTGTYFTLFGQIVILILIQIGGLGIMTISTAFALMLGQRLTLKLENIMQSVVGESKVLNLFMLLRSIVLVTVIIESIGAVVLFIQFHQVLPTGEAVYYSIFHSVSAFCNAGFALWSNSLVNFVDAPIVNICITLLIIFGGLGFTVLIDVYRYYFDPERVRKLTLHTKIVLASTVVLILIGFAAIYLAEYDGSMKGFSIARRVLSSWFQSVTLRTAGFNTIDITRLSSASVLIGIVLMFIGASPGSTGGGVKTTTFTVMVLSVLSMIRGKKDLTVFNRKIALSNAREATSLVTLSASIIFGIVFLLMLKEPFSFEKILFEAFSAFGTVGLSMGITDKLSYEGKMLITLLMYIGRIGPLTMIYAFSLSKKQLNINFAEEKIAIG